jgi:hypothetical protein
MVFNLVREGLTIQRTRKSKAVHTGVAVQIHKFLTSAQDVGQWSFYAVATARREEDISVHYQQGAEWTPEPAWREVMDKGTIYYSYRESNHFSLMSPQCFPIFHYSYLSILFTEMLITTTT